MKIRDALFIAVIVAFGMLALPFVLVCIWCQREDDEHPGY